MKNFLPIIRWVEDEKAFSVVCPREAFTAVNSHFGANNLLPSTPQGENMNRSLRSRGERDFRPVIGNVPSDLHPLDLIFGAKVKPRELGATSLNGIKSGDDRLLVIGCLFAYGTQIRRGPCTIKA